MPGTVGTSQVCCHSELWIQVHECTLKQAVVLDHHMSKTGNKVQHQKELLIDGMEVGPHWERYSVVVMLSSHVLLDCTLEWR